MPDFNALWKKITEVFGKLDNTKKIILISVVGVFLGAIILVASMSGTDSRTVLYKNLESKDFAAITSKLTELNYGFSTSGTNTIYVVPEKKEEILMALAQENLIPKGIPGWELFDEDKWSETQFEKDVKKRRAITGALSRTLSTLKSVEKASVSIAFPEKELFEDKVEPVTASIIITYAPGVEELKRKEIKGIETLVARSVPGLKKENVSIAGPDGEILNDFDSRYDKLQTEIKEVNEKLKIQEKQRIKLLKDIDDSLGFSFGAGSYGQRYDIVRLEVQMRWDKEEIEKKEVAPVTMIPDNPETPYSELEVKDSLEVSSKKTSEKFKGHGFTPEGPSGTEPNIPPGYKDKDYQRAEYEKNENIKNNEFNRTLRKIKKQPWEVEKINLAVVLDGKWVKTGENKEGTGYQRKYVPIDEEEIRKVTDLLKNAVGFSAARGDSISVKHIQRDRSKQFDQEDKELRRQKTFRKMLLATFITLLALVIAAILYQVIKKELERRRRLREEELAAQQQMMREAALRAIEDEGVEVELSLEEKARKEMLENAMNLAKERPEDVAHLLRTWLAEE